jgi:predicted small lipoprotein YifL
MTRLLKIALSAPILAAALVSLGACGKLGELDRPAPVFSSKQRATENAERAAANRANGESRADQSATSQTNGDYTQDRDGAKDPALRPLRSSPPPGAPPSPFDSRPMGGVLPDPYADPNGTPR